MNGIFLFSFKSIFSLQTLSIILVVLVVLVFIYAFFFKSNYSLNKIKKEEVGDGQHGSAKWMNEYELENHFEKVVMPEKMVDMSKQWKPGRVIHYVPKTRVAYVDTSASHIAVEAPTNVGKTTEYVIPNLMYNAMCGISMIVPDVKGELRRILEKDLVELGYRVQLISFYDVQNSMGIDYMAQLNEYVEKGENAKTEEERDYYYAKAEAECILLSTSITSTRERSSSENGFFLEASSGLIASTLFLVSMFGEKNQKHFSSVRSLIQNLGTVGKDKSALSILLGKHNPNFPPRKLSGSAYTTARETEQNIYSATLGDLRIYTNAEAEQVTSTNKTKFDWRSLINEKTIVFVELPETRKDMFAFFTLFFSQIYERLTNYAQGLPENKLPKIIKIVWDEFGISPVIKDIPHIMNVCRGRGILLDLIYQAQDQLEEKYGKIAKDIIKKACNINLYLGLSTIDIETAENISKILGKYTIKSGSVSKSRSNDDWVFNKYSESITEQMMEKPLMSADELLRLRGKKILLKQNLDPFQPSLLGYYHDNFFPKLKYTKQSDVLEAEFKEWRKVDYVDFNRIKERLSNYNPNKLPSVIRFSYVEANHTPIGVFFNAIFKKLNKWNPLKIEKKLYNSLISFLSHDDEKEKEMIMTLRTANHLEIKEFLAMLEILSKRLSKRIETDNGSSKKHILSVMKSVSDFKEVLFKQKVTHISLIEAKEND